MINYLDIMHQMHSESSPILYAIIFMFASALATFLNVLLFRMPIIIEQDILDNVKYFLDEKGIPSKELDAEADKYATLMGRSYCPNCGCMIPFYYNIPVLGWLILRGKSSCCKKPISPRYFLIEFLYSVFACVSVWHFGLVEGVGISLFAYLAIAIADIDFKIKMIPDEYSYILLWTGLLFNIDSTYSTLESGVIGAVVVYSALYAMNYIYSSLRGNDGMGGGDFKLLAAIAAWVGFESSLYVVALSCALGLLIYLILALSAKNGKVNATTEIPFAPSIATAGLIVLCLL